MLSAGSPVCSSVMATRECQVSFAQPTTVRALNADPGLRSGAAKAAVEPTAGRLAASPRAAAPVIRVRRGSGVIVIVGFLT